MIISISYAQKCSGKYCHKAVSQIFIQLMNVLLGLRHLYHKTCLRISKNVLRNELNAEKIYLEISIANKNYSWHVFRVAEETKVYMFW